MDIYRKLDLILEGHYIIINGKGYTLGEVKTLGNRHDYIFLESFSVIEDRIPGWAFSIVNSSIQSRINKNMFYAFANIRHNKVVFIGGDDLNTAIDTFSIIGEPYPEEHSEDGYVFPLPKIRAGQRDYRHIIQHTEKDSIKKGNKKYHSACINIPLIELDALLYHNMQQRRLIYTYKR